MRILTRTAYLLVSIVALHAQSPSLKVLTAFERPHGFSPRGDLVQAPDGTLYGTTYGGLEGVGTVFKVTTNGVLQTLVDFNGQNGAYPNTLSLGSDGNFYGTCGGGAGGNFFQVTPNGDLTGYFPFSAGAGPIGALVLGPDGCYYGVTRSGNFGEAFKITTNGVLTHFESFGVHRGRSPEAGLVLAADGCFYGTTFEGGLPGGAGYGSVFRLTVGGTVNDIFLFSGADGAESRAPLTQAGDGVLYGTTFAGGANGLGVVFGVTTNGQAAFLVSFDGTNGEKPRGKVVEGPDGCLYGTTSAGGDWNLGTVFRVTLDGELSTLASFAGKNGATPIGGLTLGIDGGLYGTTSEGGEAGWGTVFRVTVDGTLTTLASFSGGKGRYPAAPLTRGSDGRFYGTTASGGLHDTGAVFCTTEDGDMINVASFPGGNPARPLAALASGADGAFYGTTESGGATGTNGSVFRVTTNGELTTLVSFVGENGAQPRSGLALGEDGAFYGTTFAGGASNLGTVYRVTADGALTTLCSFDGTNGANPIAALCFAGNGCYYGTTSQGGAGNAGTVFCITTNGDLSLLASFSTTNGANPKGNLVLGADGCLYGTTANGGANGSGAAFRITPTGTLTRLASFPFMLSEARHPETGLTLGQDGRFYGVSSYGNGAIYSVSTNGVLTTLCVFSGPNGSVPRASLTLGSDGDLYGTTYFGGQTHMGVFFKVQIPPGISVQPTTAIVAEGATASLRVTASGTPVHFQWYETGGRTATAVPVMVGRRVGAAIITDGGVGYMSAPTVRFATAGPGGASGVAVIENGAVAAINIINTGFYPASPPTIQIDNPSAAGTPLLNETNADLIIPSVTGVPDANYFVVVSNSYGCVTSAVVRAAAPLTPEGLSARSVEAGVELQLLGTPGYRYVLESTTNVVPPINWNLISASPADETGIWQCLDTNITGQQRFYRAGAR